MRHTARRLLNVSIFTGLVIALAHPLALAEDDIDAAAADYRKKAHACLEMSSADRSIDQATAFASCHFSCGGVATMLSRGTSVEQLQPSIKMCEDAIASLSEANRAAIDEIIGADDDGDADSDTEKAE